MKIAFIGLLFSFTAIAIEPEQAISWLEQAQYRKILTEIDQQPNLKKNPDLIIKKIQKKFFNKKIAIRSSSINEDTETESMAGKFKSFLNIKSKDKISIKNKINNDI